MTRKSAHYLNRRQTIVRQYACGRLNHAENLSGSAYVRASCVRASCVRASCVMRACVMRACVVRPFAYDISVRIVSVYTICLTCIFKPSTRKNEQCTNTRNSIGCISIYKRNTEEQCRCSSAFLAVSVIYRYTTNAISCTCALFLFSCGGLSPFYDTYTSSAMVCDYIILFFFY